MKYTVLGKKMVSFTTADGKVINGTTLYTCYYDNTANVDGAITDKIFVTAEKMPKKEIVVGADIDVYFNRYGKVDAIAVD